MYGLLAWLKLNERGGFVNGNRYSHEDELQHICDTPLFPVRRIHKGKKVWVMRAWNDLKPLEQKVLYYRAFELEPQQQKEARHG